MIAPEKIDPRTVDPEELTPLSRIEYRGWKQGFERGRSEGRAEGRSEGRAEGRSEGRAEGERRLLLTQVEARFGPLDEATRRRIGAIESTEELERLGLRLMEASSLTDLKLNGADG